jgi:large subunit ribosomal protein L7A
MISEAEKALLHIGFKQTMRALDESSAAKVFLSEDCDTKISVPVEKLCGEKNVPVSYVPTMRELGDMCGIEVGASCAVVLSK